MLTCSFVYKMLKKKLIVNFKVIHVKMVTLRLLKNQLTCNHNLVAEKLQLFRAIKRKYY